MRWRHVVILLGVAILVAGCGSTTKDPEYPQPGRLLEKEITDRIAAFEYESGNTLLRSQRRLAYIGPPAIPYLLDGLEHRSKLTRGSCVYVLGLIREPKTIPQLVEVAREDREPSVRYEAGSALLNIGGNEGFPVLIEGLRDEDIRNRYKCYEALHAVTRYDFGYEHDGSPEEREAAVKRWEAWWETKAPE